MQNNKNINPLLRSMKTIKKSDIILFIMDFLYQEHLDKALISLEQETNISLFNYPKELLVLRNLILEGNWTESEEIINSINQNNINNFPYRKAIFELKKQQFLEAVESEPNQSSNGGDVENLVAQYNPNIPEPLNNNLNYPNNPNYINNNINNNIPRKKHNKTSKT